MRRLITLTSTHGKTSEQVVQEMMEGMAKYRAAQAKALETLVRSPSEEDEPASDIDQAETEPPTAAAKS
jgi:hypothetical protein